MDDAISRADVEQTVEDNILCYTHSDRAIDQDPDTECHMAIRTALRMLRKDLRKLPSAQPEIIHCQDCKWWEFDEEGPYKSCNAAKHYYYTKNWEIGIQRKYPGGFYCADAKTREEETEDESD